jgi:uncharacterized protein (TIGR02147 family)
MEYLKSNDILKKFFQRKRRMNAKYSLRGLAKSLAMDPGFLSRIFSGKQKFPIEQLPLFTKVLDIDTFGLNQLRQALMAEFAVGINQVFKNHGLLDIDESLNPQFQNDNEPNPVDTFAEYATSFEEESLFHPWYKMVLLEMTNLPNAEIDLKKLSLQLRVSFEDMERSWKFLIDRKFIKMDSSQKWCKTNKKIRFATKQSLLNVRRFHKEMMTKAVEEMYRFEDQSSFQKRNISSATISVNPAQIEKIKMRLQEMMLEIVDLSSQGDVEKIYGLNFSFFPILK